MAKSRKDVEGMVKRAKYVLGYKQNKELAEFLGLPQKNLGMMITRNSENLVIMLETRFAQHKDLDWVINGEIFRGSEEATEAAIIIDKFDKPQRLQLLGKLMEYANQMNAE
jgi:hypothetical protein